MSSNRLSNPSNRPVDIHDALSEVRQTGEFQPEQTNSWLDKLPPELVQWLEAQKEQLSEGLRQIAEFFQNFLSSHTGLSATALAGFWKLLTYVLIGVFAVLAVIAFYVGFVLLRRWWQNRKGHSRRAHIHRTVDGVALKNARAHREEAQNLARAGQYEAAVCALYMALLCLMDETGVVPFESNRTNLEYLRRIYSLEMVEEVRGMLQSGFAEVAQVFEAVRYGGRKTDAQGYARCEERYDNLMLRLKPQGGPPT